MGIDSAPIISSVGNFFINKKVNFLGLKTGEELENAYNMLASRKGIKKISDINKIPIVIPTVDVLESKEYIFTNCIPNGINDIQRTQYITDISVGKAVRASSSFPGVFCPCDFKKHKFLDGGALDNIPVHEVKKQGADKVIAVNFRADDIDENSSLMDIAMRMIDIMGNKISEESLEKSDFILSVKTDKTGLLDSDKLESCYKYGYQAAINNIDKIEKILDMK